MDWHEAPICDHRLRESDVLLLCKSAALAQENQELIYILAFALSIPGLMFAIIGARFASEVIWISLVPALLVTLFALAPLPASYFFQFALGGILAFVGLFCGMLLMPFGNDLFKYALFTSATAEPTPPGLWRLHQLPVTNRIGKAINHVANDDEECSRPVGLVQIQNRRFA